MAAKWKTPKLNINKLIDWVNEQRITKKKYENKKYLFSII